MTRMLLRSLHNHLAVIEVNGGAFPCTGDGDACSLSHFDERAILQAENRGRSFCCADADAAVDLISGGDQAHIVARYRVKRTVYAFHRAADGMLSGKKTIVE